MQRRLANLLIGGLCILACATVAVLAQQPPRSDVRTEDQNRDGRPDVWRVYDHHGLLSRAAFDTNFDGRTDVHEYYERGALVRREFDRDFDNTVDLVQEFDRTTRQRARSVVDVDFDGQADLLVLFQEDQPVFYKWAQQVVTSAHSALHAHAFAREPDGALAALDDPFLGDIAVKAVSIEDDPDDCIGVLASSGLPVLSPALSGPSDSFSAAPHRTPPVASSTATGPHAPRGPPASRLLG